MEKQSNVAYTLEYVRNYIELYGCKLLDDTYKNNHTKLKIQCKCGNVFYRTLAKFKNANQTQCRECSNSAVYLFEDLKKIVLDKGYEFIDEKYINFNTKHKFKCLKCGDIILSTFSAVIKSKNKVCSNCENSIFKSFKYCYDFIKKHGCKLLSKKIKNINEKLKIQCACGEIFETSFAKFRDRNKRQCNICSKTHVFTFEEIQDYFKKNDTILFSNKNDYKNTKSKLKFKCKTCDTIIERSFTDVRAITYGNICLSCAKNIYFKKRRFPQEHVKDFIKKNKCELLSDYENYTSKILVRCHCGEVYETSFSEFKVGGQRQCSICSKRISKGELFFKKYLDSLNIEYTPQKKFDELIYKNNLLFDFYIPSLNLCIEIMGLQHYQMVAKFHKTQEDFEKQIKRDDLKREYCKKNNIKLIEIPYKSINDIKKWINLSEKEVLLIE